MPVIQQLSTQISNLIAAGEVVERPASLAKELIENAIDAGATSIHVEIQHGGMRLVRVTDNGGGIPADQIQTAFLRHATSKLQSAKDLEAIHTLGFRGEALAAIAAVSRIEMMSKTPAATLGTALYLEGGSVDDQHTCGCPNGTTILVRDLFFNTPARLKFMKRDSAEGAAVFALVQRLALAHPHIAFQFIREGKKDLVTAGDGRLETVLHAVFGRDTALGFTAVAGEQNDCRIEGFVSLPTCCRGTRAFQHFIVNGRPVRSALLSNALEEAYQHQKMVGKFPACVLHLHLNPLLLDVNVHPAKIEIKFLQERAIFDALYYAVSHALSAEGRHPLLHIETPKTQTQTVQVESSPSDRLRLNDSMQNTAIQIRPLPTAPAPSPVPSFAQFSPRGTTSKSHTHTLRRSQTHTATNKTPSQPAQTTAAKPQITEVQTPQVEPLLPPDARDWTLLGETMHAFLLVEQGERLYLIDKHAAHERLLFDALQAQDYVPMVQNLITPFVLPLPPEESAALLQELPLLEQYGFSLAETDDHTLALQSIPSELSLDEAEETLADLAGKCLREEQVQPDQYRNELLHQIACKAACKAGQKQALTALMPLAEAVMSGQVKYCPHGRPVAIALTRGQLEQRFGR